MINTFRLFFALAILACLHLEAQVEVSDYGSIPEERLAINRWANIQWDSSGEWTTIQVADSGILANESYDIAPLVMDLIERGDGKRVLKFPTGDFLIKSKLVIRRNDIQIVGEGSSTRFLLDGGNNPGSFYTAGSRSGNYTLTANVARGDSIIKLTSAADFGVDDYFIIYQAGSVTRPGASGNETQILKIIEKSGDTLTLDMKFGIPFFKDFAYIEKINYRKNIRFHNFYMEMTSHPSDGNSDNMALQTVQNVEVSNVESNKALNSHVQVYRGREVIFRENNFYGNYGGGGGYQYGIKINFSTNCKVVNNLASDLRHHYATQYGTDHTVVAYNRALPPYNDYADFGQHNSKGCHNNLFEGNYGSEIYDDANPLKSWGTRYTMWFRNHATSKIGSENQYVEYMNIIGNELTKGTSAIKTGAPGKYTMAGANFVSMDEEGGNGTLIWGDLSEQDEIPVSMFLAEKPSYLDHWPLYGPGRAEPVPYIAFTHPSRDTVLMVDYTSLYVRVDTLEGSSDVKNVELYIDDVLVSADSVYPYEWGYEGASETLNLPVGRHAFKAIASRPDSLTKEVKIFVIVDSTDSPTNLYDRTSQENENTIIIYPNPARDVIHVDLRTIGECQLSIYSMNGKLVYNRQSSGTIERILSDDLPSKGAYLLQIKDSDGKLFANKIILE